MENDKVTGIIDHFHMAKMIEGMLRENLKKTKESQERIRVAIEKIVCLYYEDDSIDVGNVLNIGKGNYESDVFSFEEISDTANATRKEIFGICKVAKRISNNPEEQEIQKKENDEYQKRLDNILGEDAIKTERILTTWEGDKKPRETVVILQEKMENAIPLANVSVKEIKKDPELATKVVQFFEKLIILIEESETLADLPDLWGLEKIFRCGTALNPWFTHNILLDKDNKKIALVDNSRCQSFYSGKLSCRIAKLYFHLRNGKKHWIKKLKQYQEKLTAN